MLDIKVFPLGGCGEIGMNFTVLLVNGFYYFIDCGSLFPYKEPGVKLIFPGIKKLQEKKIFPTAWLITHGHEDHIGALPYLHPLFPAPIYSYGFATEIIKDKLHNAGLKQPELVQWQPYHTTSLPELKVTPFPVNHSIPHSLGLILDCNGFNIVHSGDFRLDYTSPEGITSVEAVKKALSGRPVHLLMADSTNSFQEGHDFDEVDVMPELEELMNATKGIVIVTTFSSNIWRVNSLIELARSVGRKVCLMGRSLERNFSIAQELNLTDENDVIFEENIHEYSKDQLVVISTGSQGELYSGMMRLAMGHVKSLQLNEDDVVVFSSRSIPGNEKSIGVVVNMLARSDCRIVLGKDKLVHVSGHAYQDDLVALFKACAPKYFMPLHGEYRHLKKHIEVLVNAGLPRENAFLVENGDLLEITDRPALKRKEVGRSRVFLGPLDKLEDAGDLTFRERTTVSESGMLGVSMVVRKESFVLLYPLKLEAVGIGVDSNAIGTQLNSLYGELIAGLALKGKLQLERIQEQLTSNLRRLVDPGGQSKPLVRYFIHQV